MAIKSLIDCDRGLGFVAGGESDLAARHLNLLASSNCLWAAWKAAYQKWRNSLNWCSEGEKSMLPNHLATLRLDVLASF